MMRDRFTALAAALILSLTAAAAGCSREKIEEGTGGASSEVGSVDAVEPGTSAAAPAPASEGATAQTGAPMGAEDTTPGGQQLSGTEAPAVGAASTAPQARGVEGVGGVAPGTGGVDSSAPASQ
jgi:hypothetical protein